MNTTRFTLAAAVMTTLGALPAAAIPLHSAQAPLNGTAVAAEPYLDATTVVAIQNFPFRVFDQAENPIFDGTLQQVVGRSNMLDVLIFETRIINTSAAANQAIVEVEFLDYIGYSTNVDYRLDRPGQVGPSTVIRMSGGDSIRFLFDAAPVQAGMTTRTIHKLTNAAFHEVGGHAIIRLNTGDSAVVTGLRIPSMPDGCPGDANADGEVNFTDLNQILSWCGLERPTFPP